jgi:hypothetical protein
MNVSPILAMLIISNLDACTGQLKGRECDNVLPGQACRAPQGGGDR